LIIICINLNNQKELLLETEEGFEKNVSNKDAFAKIIVEIYKDISIYIEGICIQC